MKKIFIFVLLYLSMQIAFAAPAIVVQYDFSYQKQQHNGIVSEKFHNKLRLLNDQQWVLVGGSKNSDTITKTGAVQQDLSRTFILLSKNEKADDEKATIKFLVLDLSAQSNFVRELTLIAKYGQKSIINLDVDNRKINITASVTK